MIVLNSPPKQAPNDSAHMSGCSGNPVLFANEIVTLIIIVVSGILSTKADAIPDTHRMRRMAIVNCDSTPTDKMTF